MNKRHFLAAVLAFCLMLTLCACGGEEAAVKTGEPDTAPSGDVTPSGDTNEGDTTPSSNTNVDAVKPTAPTPDEGEVLYTIKVVDKDGNPKANTFCVQVCLDLCMPYMTNSEGIVYFCGPEADYKISLLGDGSENVPENYKGRDHHFEDGSREMTLVYDYAAENVNGTEDEPSTNDVELQW